MRLNEGDNVFDDTVSIRKEESQYLRTAIINMIPFTNVQFDIGSVGYKAESGDMDVFVDQDKIMEHFGSKDAKTAKQALAKFIHDQGYDVAIKGRNVHVRMYDSQKMPVQIDVMVIPNSEEVAPWHQHGPRGSYNDKEFKGATLFIIMNSIGKALGLKFDAFSGQLKSRETNEVVATGRDNVAKILLNPNATGNDLNTVKSIYAALQNDPQKDQKLSQAREDAKKGIIQLPESKTRDPWYRDVMSTVIVEAARIEHPEDYLLDGSKSSAIAAVDGMLSLAKEMAKAPKDVDQHFDSTTI